VLDGYLFIPDFINIMFLCQEMPETFGICNKCTSLEMHMCITLAKKPEC